MTALEELFALAEDLAQASAQVNSDNLESPLKDLERAAEDVGSSFSGSWEGYHACVYYAGFKRPPTGAHFSQEWGLMDTYGTRHGSRGE